MRERGLDIDMSSLVYAGERSHVMEYLGWQVTGVSTTELFTEAGFNVPDLSDEGPMGEIVYVSATLG
jgi:hypothetical protein